MQKKPNVQYRLIEKLNGVDYKSELADGYVIEVGNIIFVL